MGWRGRAGRSSFFWAIRKVVLFLWNMEGPALFHVPASNLDPGIYICLDLLDPNSTFRFDEIHVLMFQNLEDCKINFFLLLSSELMLVAGLWIRIRMDPHSFSLLDPDPGG